MVKFVAKKGVNFETLEELEALLGDPSISNRKSDSFVVKSGDAKLKVKGDGFLYINDVPVSGKISSIKAYADGDLAYTLSKLDLKVTKALDFDSVEEALKKILKGDDTLIGSGEGDILNGLKGDDNIKGKGGDDELLGDKGDDVLKGNAGDDLLDGGKNDDVLNGGGGLDTYAFTVKPGKAGVDTITNFQAGEEIHLASGPFDVGPVGALNPALFTAGANATDADHRIIYNQGNGKIYSDRDGDGPKGKVLFAKVDAGTALDAGDFMVI